MSQSPLDKVSLVQTLEKRGLLDITKAYLRSNIYENLKTSSASNLSSMHFNQSSQAKGFSDNLSIKLSISLIIDFLRKLNLSYTLNVFNNESKSLLNTYPYTESEMLSILNVKVANLNSNPDELFNSFLCFLSKEKMTPRHCINTESQTDYRMTETTSSTQVPIDELLRNVEMKYSSKVSMDALLPSKSFEERMIKYRTELDSRYKVDLEAAIRRFKEIEAAQIRIEENRKYLKKTEDIKDAYEKEYKAKFDSLAQRESDFKMRIAQKEADYEALQHQHRRKFQDELEVIKIKEEEMNRKVENEVDRLRLEQSKLQFQIKENEYIKDTSSKKVTEQLELFKSEYEKTMENERKEIERRSNEWTKRELVQSSFQEKYDGCVRERNELSDTVKQLRAELKLVTAGQDRLSKDNDSLREEIRAMTLHEKRSADVIAKNDIEIRLLKDEIQLFKQSLDVHKLYNDNKRTDIYEELNKKVKEINDTASVTKADIGKEQSELYKSKIKSLEETCSKYKDMCNTLIHKSNSPSVNRASGMNEMSATITKPMSRTFTSHLQGGMHITDRRRVLAQLEDEQITLNKEIKASFRNLTRKEPPVIAFTEGQLKQIQRDNYLKNVIETEKEKVVQMIYKRNELNDNEKREVIDSNSALINNFTSTLKDEMKRETELTNQRVSSNKSEEKRQPQKEIKGNATHSIRNEQKPLYSNEATSSISNSQSKLQTTTENKRNEDEDKQKKLPVPTVISGPPRSNSYRNQGTEKENEISVENITSDSKERNSDKNKENSERKPLPQQGMKPSDKAPLINTSIKEEIEESHSQSQNISNLIENVIKNSSSEANKSSLINKFQNIDYESKKEEPSGIEEYGEDFVEDLEGLEKHKLSLDLEAMRQASIGHLSAKGRQSNPSSSINKSSGSNVIDKVIQSHPSNIEENIEEEISYENSNSKKEKSKGNEGNEDSSSNKYNDFVSSNANLTTKKDGTIGKEHISGEIKEEIGPDEDDDGYNPY